MLADAARELDGSKHDPDAPPGWWDGEEAAYADAMAVMSRSRGRRR